MLKSITGMFPVYPGSRRSRLRAVTLTCTKRFRQPEDFFGEQVGKNRYFNAQERPWPAPARYRTCPWGSTNRDLE